MENLRPAKPNQGLWAVRLGLPTGLALLFIMASLWGLHSMTPAHADPGILYVDGATGSDTTDCTNPAAPCATIGYALTQADNGDEIRVAQGVYTENLTIANKTITLRGGYTISGTAWLTDTGETIVNGNGADRTFLIHGNNSVLENLTITGGNTPDAECWGGGVWVTNGDVTIRSSTITGNWADCSGGGVEVNSDWGPAHLTVEDSVVVDNGSGGDAGGVSVWHTGAHLTNTLIVSNTASNASALRIEDSDVTIQNCTIADNQGGAAVNAYDTDAQADALIVRNSIVWGNMDTNLACTVQTCTVTYSDIEGGWPGTGNLSTNPAFVDPADGDYHLQPWSPCIDAGTADGAPDHDFEGDPRPQNEGYDMGADEFVGTPIKNEGPRYIATAGSDAANLCLAPDAPCQTIGHALDMANAGESVLVAQGTYTENLTISKPVTLTGGYESTNWRRDIALYETILDGSGSQTVVGDWDGNSIESPVVISTGVVFEMWYEGWPTIGDGQLGRATSSDKVTWTKDAGNPLFGSGAPGAWDEGSVSEPFVLLDDGTYKLWYTASRRPTGYAISTNGTAGTQHPDPLREAGPQGAWPFATGYATSTDGVTWTRHPVPVLEGGPKEAWDRSGIRDPYIVKGTYTMWYGAWTDTTGQIGCATSTDGINWTKCAANPVLGPGNPGDWDETAVHDPVVVLHDGTYHMWYGGTGPDWTWHIGYVTSTNGITWTRFLTGPILSGTDGEWDEGSVVPGDVSFDGATYHMWYEANGQIGYAWSSDGISWTKSPSNPVLSHGMPGQWGEPVVRFEEGSYGAVLDGFTITGGDAQEAGGVHAGEANVTIRNCLIRDNFADGSPTSWGGGGVLGGTSLTIIDSRIINNEVNQGASGVRVGEGQLTMINTLVADNRGAEGLHLNGGANLMNVTVANNAIGTGRPGVNFNPQTGGNLVVVNSIVYGNGTGDAFHVPDPGTIQASYSDIQGGWSGTGNIDANPSFVDLANGDYHLQAWSPCIDAGTAASAPDHDFEGDPRPQNAGYDIGADEFVGTPIPPALYVDGATGSDTTDCSNPAAPCATIGYALTQAGNGDEIRVAEGTYTETLDVAGNPITLRGGYTVSGTLWLPRTGETVVDASGADNSVFTISPNNNVTVEGFTVQGANHVSDWGGGFFVNGATVVISDTVVRDNWTDGAGGGAYVEGDANVSLINSTFTANFAYMAAGFRSVGTGQVMMENTVFAGNTGGAVLGLNGPSFEVVGGKVSSNTVSGPVAMHISDGSSGTISGTEIVSNTSGAMHIWPDTVVSAHDLTIRGNTAGGIVNQGVLTITNSLIEDNSGGDWAVVGSENFAETNRLVMDDCTIRGNDTPGVVGITTGYAEIRNTKIVNNSNDAVFNIGEDGTTPTVEMVNVLLADNETQGHAVVNHVTGSAMLMNVTATGSDVADNWILYTNGTMTVANTIVWGNTTNIAMLGGPGTLLVSYSDIEGGWTGTGNLDADPLFVDAASGDYHLQVGSPCIDAGTSVGAPAHDIEGTPRDAAPDMGAYEWTGFRIFLPLTLKSFTGKQ